MKKLLLFGVLTFCSVRLLAGLLYTLADVPPLLKVSHHSFHPDNLSTSIPPDLVSVEITGASTIDEDSSSQYTCTGTYSDTSTANLTSTATWQELTTLSNVTLGATGLVTVGDRDTTNNYSFRAYVGAIADTNTVSIQGAVEIAFSGNYPEALFADIGPTQTFPASFTPFEPPVSNYVSSGSPVVYERSRIAEPSQALVLTGGDFSTHTNVVDTDVYTVTSVLVGNGSGQENIRIPSYTWQTNDTLEMVFYAHTAPSNPDVVFYGGSTANEVYHDGSNLECSDNDGGTIQMAYTPSATNTLVYDFNNQEVILNGSTNALANSGVNGTSNQTEIGNRRGFSDRDYPLQLLSFKIYRDDGLIHEMSFQPDGTITNTVDGSEYFLVDVEHIPTTVSRTITISGEEGKDTRFTAYGYGVTSVCDIAAQKGLRAIITLPDDLPQDEFYLVWPENGNGLGYPFAVNQAEYWWHEDRIEAGDTFAAHGRNLGLDCHAYCVESNVWLAPVSCDPYRAVFQMTNSWADGDYTFRLHSGKGQEYGWAQTNFVVTVADRFKWDGSTLNVTNYGSVQAAISAASSTDTIYFPSNDSPYEVDGYLVNISGKQLLGDTNAQGEAVSVLQDADTHDEAAGSGLVFNGPTTNFKSQNMRFSKNSGQNRDQSFAKTEFSSNLVFNNCWFDNFDGSIAPSASSGDFFKLNGTEQIYINGGKGTAIGPNGFLTVMSCDQTYVEGIDLKFAREATQIIFTAGRGGQSYRNMDIGPYDGTTNSHSDGRWLTIGNAAAANIYVSGCESDEAAPPVGYGNINTGEQIMKEGSPVEIVASATAGTLDSITLTVTNYTLSGVTNPITAGSMISIVDGAGYGQTRIIGDRTGFVYTMTEDWYAAPDSTSVAMVHNPLYRLAVYDNSFDGRFEWITNGIPGVASRALNMFGGAVYTVFASNTVRDIPLVATYWPVVDSELAPNGTNYLQLVAFNTFIDNDCRDMRIGVQSLDSAAEANDFNGGMIGLVIQGNYFSNVINNVVQSSSGTTGVHHLMAFVSNTVEAVSGYAISESPGLGLCAYMDNSGDVSDTVYSLAYDHQPVLIGNSFSGYTDLYYQYNEAYPTEYLHTVLKPLSSNGQVQVWNTSVTTNSITNLTTLAVYNLSPDSGTNLSLSSGVYTNASRGVKRQFEIE